MATESHTKTKGKFLEERTREIFEELGYSVTTEGAVIRAKRGNKVVRVTTVTDGSFDSCPLQWEDDKYCFVMESGDVERLGGKVAEIVPSDSDWALIGVDERDHRVF